MEVPQDIDDDWYRVFEHTSHREWLLNSEENCKISSKHLSMLTIFEQINNKFRTNSSEGLVAEFQRKAQIESAFSICGEFYNNFKQTIIISNNNKL